MTVGEDFSLYQGDGGAGEEPVAGDFEAGLKQLPAGGDFELAMREAGGVPVDADGDGTPDGLAFDLAQDGVPDVVELDTDGDGIGDTGLFDLDQDGVADVAMVDTDGDGTADTTFDLAQVDEPAAGREGGEEADDGGQSLTDPPDDIGQSDVQEAADDYSAQTHIQSGMNSMYGAIYHEPVDPF